MNASTQHGHNLASQYALYSFETYIHGIGGKMLVWKNTCKCFQKLCLGKITYMQHQNTISQQQSQSLFKVYTFRYEAIFVIVQVQVVKTTQHTTSSNLYSIKISNPNSNPNALNYTILQKDCHNVCLKYYPKQYNKQLEACKFGFHLTKQLCISPPHHSKNRIGHP